MSQPTVIEIFLLSVEILPSAFEEAARKARFLFLDHAFSISLRCVSYDGKDFTAIFDAIESYSLD